MAEFKGLPTCEKQWTGKDGWPKYSRERNGRRHLQWRDAAGVKRSIREFLPDEPRNGYETRGECNAAMQRWMDHLRQGHDRSETVAGFAELWSDPWLSPWRKVVGGGNRSEQTLLKNRTKVQRFVDLYPDVPMIQIQYRPHVRAFLDLPAKGERAISVSSLVALALMWKDAASEHGGQIVTSNPWAEIAHQAEVEERRRRGDDEIDAPTPEQIAAMLDEAYRCYPTGFARWLEFGTETGMRCAELDAVRFEFISYPSDPESDDPVLYDLREQWNDALQCLTPLKWDRTGKGRQIALSPRALEILDEARADADRQGSPYAFLTEKGDHLTNGYRDRYWTGDKTCQPLRRLVGGMAMKNATRHYYATKMLAHFNWCDMQDPPIGRPDISLLAEHMGHSRAVLEAHYAKRYQRDAQRGMHKAQSTMRRDELAPRRRRKAA